MSEGIAQHIVDVPVSQAMKEIQAFVSFSAKRIIMHRFDMSHPGANFRSGQGDTARADGCAPCASHEDFVEVVRVSPLVPRILENSWNCDVPVPFFWVWRLVALMACMWPLPFRNVDLPTEHVPTCLCCTVDRVCGSSALRGSRQLSMSVK